MAELYVKEMREFYPAGSYILGGSCFGATIAYEMARQLQASNITVPTLLVFDAGPPKFRKKKKAKQNKNLPSKIRAYASNKQLAHITQLYLSNKLDKYIIQLKKRAKNIRLHLTERHHFHVLQAHHQAGDTYRTQPTTIEQIILFRSTEFHTKKRKDWHRQWAELTTGSFNQTIIPAKHLRFLRNPSVVQLASEIESYLCNISTKVVRLRDSHLEDDYHMTRGLPDYFVNDQVKVTPSAPEWIIGQQLYHQEPITVDDKAHC